MNFKQSEALEILERTPAVLTNLLSGLSNEWVNGNEGGDSWNSLEVVAHLIDCEKSNWIPRINSILSSYEDAPLQPFDRFSHLGKETGVEELLREFSQSRQQSLYQLGTLKISSLDLNKTGLHPEFGFITLQQLLSTWAVHDLTHINQISRVLAKRYDFDVGPWKTYLSILK
ncbi:DinB family protein [Fictibacillus sp. 18YEL24]|uniref:DinB family protein n=1 Tax=Fictibacillus sp. 18YEL24 TaxID=2745875 RepID=UPI0018CD6997|nr:DinB family protein [Fictibacillus sp. 18YEL24]MBH0170052.1 DinB family protein [Fictibacillus sp. 18YEL24]